MKDRVPALGKANRVKITQDNGQIVEGVLSYADEAIEEGSAWNKANVLPDDVAATLGLTGNPQVKDALLELGTHGVDVLADKYFPSGMELNTAYTIELAESIRNYKLVVISLYKLAWSSRTNSMYIVGSGGENVLIYFGGADSSTYNPTDDNGVVILIPPEDDSFNIYGMSVCYSSSGGANSVNLPINNPTSLTFISTSRAYTTAGIRVLGVR